MKMFYVLALAAGLTASLGAFETYKEAVTAGQQAFKAKKWDEALKNFEEAEKLGANTKEKYDALNQEVNSLIQLKKWDDITTASDKILALEDTTPAQLGIAKFNKARVYIWKRQTKDGLEMFLACAADATMHPSHRGELAIAAGNELRSQKKYDEAIAAFQIVLSLEKPDQNQLTNAYISLSRCYQDKKEMAEALSMATKASEVEKANVGVRANAFARIGEVCIAEKKFDEAIAAYSKMLELDKVPAYNQAQAYTNQARCYVALKKYEDAQKAIDAGKEVKGILHWQLFQLATHQAAVFNAAQKYQESIDNYLEVQKIEKMPADCVDQINLYVGNLYFNNLKNNEKAKEFYEMAAKGKTGWVKNSANAQLKKIPAAAN